MRKRLCREILELFLFKYTSYPTKGTFKKVLLLLLTLLLVFIDLHIIHI